MARRGCVCGICENVNQASVCISCINQSFLEKYKLLKDLAQDRDLLRWHLDEELIAKFRRLLSVEWEFFIPAIFSGQQIATYVAPLSTTCLCSRVVLRCWLRIGQREAELQGLWRVDHLELRNNLRECLQLCKEEVAQGKKKCEQQQCDLDAKNSLLAQASAKVAMKWTEKLAHYYPDFIRAQCLVHMAVTSDLFQKQHLVM